MTPVPITTTFLRSDMQPLRRETTKNTKATKQEIRKAKTILNILIYQFVLIFFLVFLVFRGLSSLLGREACAERVFRVEDQGGVGRDVPLARDARNHSAAFDSDCALEH